MNSQSTSNDSRRLFIGFPVPREISTRITMLKTLVPVSDTGIRWVSGGNLHVTLSFLGQISSETEKEVHQLLSGAILPERFRISIENTGIFPNGKNPRIFWMGISRGREALIQLQSTIEILINPLKNKQDTNQFVPHITIGRANRKKNFVNLDLSLYLHAVYEPVDFQLNRCYLYQSELLPQGAKYTVLAEYPLK